LEALDAMMAEVVSEAVTGGALRIADEADLVSLLSAASRVGRRLDAVLIDAVGEVEKRSSSGDRDDRMTTRFGCHDVSELVERATLCSRSSVSRLRRASTAVQREVSITTGELLEPALPGMRAAMCEGLVGVDGLVAVAGPLLSAGSRITREALLAADAALAAEVRGDGPDGGPPMGADLLRVQAQAWSIALDQDGAEPRERMTERKRSFTLGAPTDGGVPCRGNLMPEVAAQLQMIFDAHSNPAYHGVRFAEEFPGGGEPDDAVVPRDFRTRAQQQHDALASALSVAASSGLLPTIGGAAPTLIVSVREEDAQRGEGYAHAQGCDLPLGMAAAQHIGCAGTIQRITSRDDGRIVRIGIEERVFNRHQRRAIALRDGGCIIPGCGIPAGWCEIHHVLEHVNGGPTHTDNGVLLCWFHHRFIDWHGWKIRMNHGVPEVRAPSWCDATLRWRPVTSSKTRLHDAVLRQ
ncbi:DUF222 domain-containing protein, partial [Microbacterium sp. P5_E9]